MGWVRMFLTVYFPATSILLVVTSLVHEAKVMTYLWHMIVPPQAIWPSLKISTCQGATWSFPGLLETSPQPVQLVFAVKEGRKELSLMVIANQLLTKTNALIHAIEKKLQQEEQTPL